MFNCWICSLLLLVVAGAFYFRFEFDIFSSYSLRVKLEELNETHIDLRFDFDVLERHFNNLSAEFSQFKRETQIRLNNIEEFLFGKK